MILKIIISLSRRNFDNYDFLVSSSIEMVLLIYCRLVSYQTHNTPIFLNFIFTKIPSKESNYYTLQENIQIVPHRMQCNSIIKTTRLRLYRTLLRMVKVVQNTQCEQNSEFFLLLQKLVQGVTTVLKMVQIRLPFLGRICCNEASV